MMLMSSSLPFYSFASRVIFHAEQVAKYLTREG